MQRSSARRSKNIPFSVCRRQGDSSLPSGCTQQPSEITRQGRGKSAEKEPEKRIKDLPFRSADKQPRERRHTENHTPKRQQWQNTHRLPSIQREVPQMPVLTVPLEDRKSRPLRKFIFQRTPPPERGGRYFPPSFPCGMPQAAAVHRESYRPQTRGQKNEYMHSHPVLSFAFCASLFSALLSMYSRFIDNIRKRSACSADPHLRMALLSSFQGPPMSHAPKCPFISNPAFCISP